MKPVQLEWIKRGAWCCLAFISLAGVCAGLGMRINTSASIPVGIYWTTSDQIHRGAFIQFCPEQRQVFELARSRGYVPAGQCPGRFGYLFKQVAAMAGDMVLIESSGVSINGKTWINSAPLAFDRQGRVIPMHRHMGLLSADQVLVMSDRSPISFDSRYFGPISLAKIKTVIVPILTWS